MKSAKGGQFEREVSRQLSLWWTKGNADDVFWRSTTSGARATTRKKQGKGTHGQCGDLCATNKIGLPLLDLLTLELKNGYSKRSIMDSIDKTEKKVASGTVSIFEEWIIQAMDAADNAGSASWAIIHKRNSREPMIYFPLHIGRRLHEMGAAFDKCPMGIQAGVVLTQRNNEVVTLFGMRLCDFLIAVAPHQIKTLARQL